MEHWLQRKPVAACGESFIRVLSGRGKHAADQSSQARSSIGMTLSERARVRGGVFALLVVAVVVVVLLELNLLGITNFPIVRPQRTERDRALARVLLGAKNQCRFGHALVSAGNTHRARIRPSRFARIYAQSFGGTTEGERDRIRQACLTGLSHRHGGR
jgi:hypothetical protein